MTAASSMPALETVTGTIAALLRREGHDPVTLEFELRDNGGTRRVRTIGEDGSRLREGDRITVTGHTDPNQILVAHTITAFVPPPPPIPTKRRQLWLWLVAPLVALATMLLASGTIGLVRFISRPLGDLIKPLIFLIGVALIFLARRRASHATRVLLRVAGGATLVTVLLFYVAGC